MARGKGRSGRRYVRDNRGRFASKGAGATARGGRLKTASGKKRATQTMKVAGSGSKIRKPMSSGSNKPAQQISSKRQSAADRLKIKTATRRKLKTDRASVIPAKSAGPKTMKASRISSTVAKPRTKGNSPQQVASRVKRKAAANQANLSSIVRAERTGATQGRQYQRALKTQATLKRAQEFTKTGKLPGRDNSIKAQRQIKEATARINAKRAARQRGDTAAAAKPRAKRAVTTSSSFTNLNAARLRRAQQNIERTKDVRTGATAMSKASFARRPSPKTSRSNRRAETARDIYTASPEKRKQIIRNQKSLARTDRARQNWTQTREDRIKNAEGTGMSFVKIGRKSRKSRRRR